MNNPTPKLRSASVVLLAMFAAGCAATRSTFDLPVPRVEASTAKGFIKITEVNDKRHFEASPKEPSIPSLQDPKEINDPAITSRAIARKRGGFGNAMADILLPEERTVAPVVREAVSKAANDAGYAVVDEKSQRYAEALPLKIDIQQFWSWFTPGFWAIKVEFEGIVVMNGDMIVPTPVQEVRGYAMVEAAAATDGVWQDVMQQGLTDLIAKMKGKFKPPE